MVGQTFGQRARAEFRLWPRLNLWNSEPVEFCGALRGGPRRERRRACLLQGDAPLQPR